MNWLSALAAFARVIAAILDMAREANARGAGRAKPLRRLQPMHLISSLRPVLRAALLLTPLSILPGCATTTGSAGTDAVACSAFEPIRWSAKDTDETIRQVREHNAAWKAVCSIRK
jgi:hypothetical protein